MVVRFAPDDWQELSVIRVADERRAPVGPEVCADVFEHRAEPVPVSSLNLDSVRAAECEGVEEQLRDEAVVAGRGFAVRAVVQDLLVHLAQCLAQPERAPLFSRAQLRQADAEPQKAHNVREVMIARRDVGELKVASDVLTVRVEEREELCEPTFVERARTSE